MMKICCVVVWYNPNEKCFANLLSYKEKFERVYIIDNSITDNSNLLLEKDNIFYFPNRENLGIAKALNMGCEMAFSAQYDWCMTMDQDSYWDPKQLQSYMAKVEMNADLQVKSFAPNLRNNKNVETSVLGDLRRKIVKSSAIPVMYNSEYPNRVITSGNVISLSIWNDVGRFCEPLFIDEVDHDFCFRLISKGYKIKYCDDVYMFHEIGSPKKTFFPQFDSHNGIRLYYMYRNMLYIKKQYPNFWRLEGYKSQFWKIIRQNLFRLKIKNLRYICLGVSHFNKGIMGKYCYGK